MQPVRKGSAMFSKRSNSKTLHAAPGADACFDAMRRHHERRTPSASGAKGPAPPVSTEPVQAPVSSGRDIEGDIVYGARAIAKFIFSDASNTARRRVFNLWAFHQARDERTGFFKMKGGLCLSKSQWRAFHGLD
jgi:hypothetical protein